MKYFGTDGIRGKAFDFITVEMAYSVGRSLGLLEKKKVIVCRDTRASGLNIVKAIKRGVIDSGLEVLDIDILATPILAYMSLIHECYGVMVTASHNPYTDNGIKIFNKGYKTTPEEEQIIEDVIDGVTELKKANRGIELAYFNPLYTYGALYKNIQFKCKKKIVLDLANGATIKSAKFILNQTCSNLEYIGDEPNGYNINDNVGSTHIDKLRNYVLNNGFDIGISFDGDGDRVLVVDGEGTIIDGDLLIYIFATYLKEIGKLNNNLVVLTKMSNIGIIKALKEKGIETVQTDIGDKYVIKAMNELDATIGGENSGHIINKYLFISGDGVLNAAFLLMILVEKNTTIKELIKDVSFYPDRLHNIKNIDKSLVNDKRIIKLVDKIREDLGEEGKVLVRPSGTEPMIRISASAKTKEQVDNIIKIIEDKFKEIIKEKE